jgi:NADH:ubiquinone reductase (H+-translocating)
MLYLVASFRNRLSVLVQWAYQYLTFQRGVRLITGTTVHRLLKASRAAADKRRVA